MELNLFSVSGYQLAEVISDDTIVQTEQDAVDMMANAQYQGAEHLILHQKNIVPDFFDLSTGLAGGILQKFSNYQMKLTIIGDFEASASESLRAFIIESNRGTQVAFVKDKHDALARLEREA